MLRNIVLVVSLAVNALAIYVVFNPSRSSWPKMTCEQARHEFMNKQAAATFALRNGDSFYKLHGYLFSSDFRLRNISSEGTSATFVYTAEVYPSTCGTLLGGIDGSIIRVTTDLAAEPRVVSIY